VSKEEILKLGRGVILEEARALRRLADSLDENFVRAVELILSCEGKVVLTGIGKSGHIARKISSTFSSTGTPSVFLHPAEALHGDLGLVDRKDLVIAISNSGESEEVLKLIPYFKLHNNPIIGITAKPDSSLAKRSDIVLRIPLEEEAGPLGLAPTTSAVLTLALGDALAMAVMKLRGFKEEDFGKRHPAGAGSSGS